jgi:putative protease
VGRVEHYFDKIGVAVLKLSDTLKVGDIIRIEGGQDTDFKQTVKSLQFNHQKIVQAKKGQDVGLKVKEVAREGYKVYKIYG